LVHLEPIAHKYIHRETNKKYSSVTTTLSSIEPHFDVEGVSAAIVKQQIVQNKKDILITQMQIIDYWQMLNEANVYGTMVHDIVERYLLADSGICLILKEKFEQK
jgi:hypothetical protein